MGYEFMLPVDTKPMEPAASHWTKSEYYIPDPSLPRGDFFDASSGNFACSRSVLSRIHQCVDRDCEILPIVIEGLENEEYVLIHPIKIIHALPQGLASRRMDLIMSFNSPRYERSAFDRAAIFRDPQQGSSSVCVSGLGPEELDFYIQYQRQMLSGLELRKVWEHA